MAHSPELMDPDRSFLAQTDAMRVCIRPSCSTILGPEWKTSMCLPCLECQHVSKFAKGSKRKTTRKKSARNPTEPQRMLCTLCSEKMGSGGGSGAPNVCASCRLHDGKIALGGHLQPTCDLPTHTVPLLSADAEVTTTSQIEGAITSLAEITLRERVHPVRDYPLDGFDNLDMR